MGAHIYFLSRPCVKKRAKDSFPCQPKTTGVYSLEEHTIVDKNLHAQIQSTATPRKSFVSEKLWYVHATYCLNASKKKTYCLRPPMLYNFFLKKKWHKMKETNKRRDYVHLSKWIPSSSSHMIYNILVGNVKQQLSMCTGALNCTVPNKFTIFNNFGFLSLHTYHPCSSA